MDFAAVTCERYSEVIEAKLEPLMNSSVICMDIRGGFASHTPIEDGACDEGVAKNGGNHSTCMVTIHSWQE